MDLPKKQAVYSTHPLQNRVKRRSMNEIAFQYRPATSEEHNETVRHLKAHTEAAVGMPLQHVPFGLFAYDGETLIGSIIGKSYFNWLHLDLIWVHERFQRRGIGTRLMRHAEEKAHMLGLNGIETWTQSWQAPEFYRKLGYQEFAVMDDFTPGRKRHAFRLQLNKGSA